MRYIRVDKLCEKLLLYMSLCECELSTQKVFIIIYFVWMTDKLNMKLQYYVICSNMLN